MKKYLLLAALGVMVSAGHTAQASVGAKEVAKAQRAPVAFAALTMESNGKGGVWGDKAS